MPRLQVKITSIEQLNHVRNAEKELSLAGVTFDMGCAVDKGIPTTRDWELDWSLLGATLSYSKEEIAEITKDV